MCGRYFFQLEDQEAYFFRDQLLQEHLFSFQQGEIFPSQNALVLKQKDRKEVSAAVMKWGIHGYKGKLLINARMEGITETYTFRPLYHQRCAIVANGFYEWRKQETRKEKLYIRKAGVPLIYFAGLYNEAGEFVIVTGEAQKEMARVHHRTPIIMEEAAMRSYLQETRDFIVDNKQLLFEKG